MIRIITISGVDGSGKSTQIERLQNYFTDQGKKVYYFHVVQFSLLQQLKDKLKGNTSSGKKADTAITHSPLFGIWLRKVFLPIDLWRFKRLVKRLDAEGYDILLSDRYFYDTMVNIAYLENKETFMNRTIKKPDLSFFFDAQPEHIMERPRAPEQGLAYLVAKQALYKKLAKENGLIVINADQTPDNVYNKLLEVCTRT